MAYQRPTRTTQVVRKADDSAIENVTKLINETKSKANKDIALIISNKDLEQEALNSLLDNKKSLQEAVNILSKTIKDKQAEIEDITKIAAKLKDDCDRAAMTNIRLEEDAAERRKLIASLNDDYQAQSSKNITAITALDKAASVIRHDIDRLAIAKDEAQASLVAEREKMADDKERHAMQLADADREYTALRQSIQELRDTLSHEKAKLDGIIANKSAIEREAEGLQALITSQECVKIENQRIAKELSERSIELNVRSEALNNRLSMIISREKALKEAEKKI